MNIAWAHHACHGLMLVVALLASVSDMRRGVIPNALLRKALWAVAALGVLVTFSTFSWWPLPTGLPPDIAPRDAAVAVLGNAAFGVIVSLLLYVFGLWAAGDAKLAMVLALAQPAWIALPGPLPWAPFSIVLGNTFLAAFVAVVIEVVFRRAPSSLRAVRTAIAERRSPVALDGLGDVVRLGLVTAALIGALGPIRRLAGQWAAGIISGGYFIALLIVVIAYRPLKRAVATGPGVIVVVVLFLGSATFSIVTNGWDGLVGVGHSLLFCLAVMTVLGLFGEASRPLDSRSVAAGDLKPGMVLSDNFLDLLEVEPRWVEAFAPVIPTLRDVKLDDNLIENLREWHAHNTPDVEFLVRSHIPFAPAFAVGVALTAIFGRLVFVLP